MASSFLETKTMARSLSSRLHRGRILRERMTPLKILNGSKTENGAQIELGLESTQTGSHSAAICRRSALLARMALENVGRLWSVQRNDGFEIHINMTMVLHYGSGVFHRISGLPASHSLIEATCVPHSEW